MLPYEDQIRKCVAFLAVEEEAEENPGQRVRRPKGTAFFVKAQIPGKDLYVLYAVSARHNIEHARAAGTLFIRVNLKGGKVTEIPLPPDSWTVHPTTDVAVTSLDLPSDIEAVALTANHLLDDSNKFKSLFAAGDDVIMAALFSKHPGSIQNEPIVRFGKISLLPKEPVTVEIGPQITQAVQAILIEATSWGGESGAPVFVDRSQHGGPGPYLLGLLHGHHQLRQTLQIQGEERGEVAMNAGIAIVIPAQKITETLMQEELVQERIAVGKRFGQER